MKASCADRAHIRAHRMRVLAQSVRCPAVRRDVEVLCETESVTEHGAIRSETVDQQEKWAPSGVDSG